MKTKKQKKPTGLLTFGVKMKQIACIEKMIQFPGDLTMIGNKGSSLACPVTTWT